MTDREHLQWIYDRMEDRHSESRNVDYMIRLKKIIDNMEEVEYCECGIRK